MPPAGDPLHVHDARIAHDRRLRILLQNTDRVLVEPRHRVQVLAREGEPIFADRLAFDDLVLWYQRDAVVTPRARRIRDAAVDLDTSRCKAQAPALRQLPG